MPNWLCTPRGRAYRLLNKAQTRAKAAGLEYTLTTAWVLARLDAGCEVTGLPFELGRDGTTKPFAASIDRRDNTKGYTEDNCRLVCLIFNYAKCTWSDADVRTMAAALLAR